ncbi:MAG: nucleoside-diphosphate kinase [Bacteroidota bacterium]
MEKLQVDGDYTVAILKPDVVKDKQVGKIITIMEENGFEILDCMLRRFTVQGAAKFYKVHQERPFYKDLTEYIASGHVVMLALRKDNAVPDFRTLIGATDPAEAAPGTIRKQFGKSIERNAVHGSDSVETAEWELNLLFSAFPRFAGEPWS